MKMTPIEILKKYNYSEFMKEKSALIEVGLNPSTASKIATVLKEGDVKQLENIKLGKISIYAVYNLLRPNNRFDSPYTIRKLIEKNILEHIRKLKQYQHNQYFKDQSLYSEILAQHLEGLYTDNLITDVFFYRCVLLLRHRNLLLPSKVFHETTNAKFQFPSLSDEILNKWEEDPSCYRKSMIENKLI